MNDTHWSVVIKVFSKNGKAYRTIRTTASKARTVEQVTAWAIRKHGRGTRTDVRVS